MVKREPFPYRVQCAVIDEGRGGAGGRDGCELILASESPDKVGKGLMFISLNEEVLNALRAELEGRVVNVKEGLWGYRVMVIRDPDGNEFYFPYEGLKVKGTLQKF